MTAALNMLAVQNAAVLRALRKAPEDGWSLTELAQHLGRDKSNLSKTLNKLEDEGLIKFNPLANGLADAGEQQLTMIERAEGGAGAEPGSPSDTTATGMVWLRHAEIQPDPENARRDWDSHEAKDELDNLRADIVTNGLLQNLVVRGPDADGIYILVGGERRWRAIGEAITDGDIEFDTPFACRLLETDDLGVRLAALAENLQRRNLNPIEKATAFEGLAVAGLTNKEIAGYVGSTPEHIQQHRRFLQLDEADQQRMALSKDDPRHLSVREARQKLAIKSQTEEASAAQDERDAKITPDVKLALAEFMHRVRVEAAYTTADLKVSADARETAIGTALAELGWVAFTDAPSNWGKTAGHYTARLQWNVPQLFDWQNSADRDVLFAGLAAAYADHGTPPPTQGYVNAWLNPDPALTPEGQEIATEAAERERASVAAQAAHDEANRIRRERWARARANHAALLNPASTDAADIEAATATAAEEADHKLPWTLFDNGEIKDATSETVTSFGNWGRLSDQDMTVAQIIVVSVNRAGGFDTPPIASSAEPEPAQAEDGDDTEEEAA